MKYYILSFHRKITTENELNGSETVVALLIKNQCTNLDSRIPGTIVFESSKSLASLFETLCSLKEDFHFHILPVAMPTTPEPSSRHSKGVRDAFLKEVGVIKNGLS